MIKLKNDYDIEMIAQSGRILAEVLEKICKKAQPDVSLKSLEYSARRLIKKAGAKPAFLGYQPESGSRPFPAALCLSINEQIVHGLPSAYKLRSGDLLKIDLGVNYRGYFSDAALTIGIGEISTSARKLIKTTQDALTAAIKTAQPGGHLGDIGAIIENTIVKNGFSVIKELTGHGVGFELHEDPTILNYGKKGEGMELKPGMVLAIEPMACLGSGKIIQRPDDSFATADNSLSAHSEHTIAITKHGPRVLTI
jgi:methionyl aminopeptidase